VQIVESGPVLRKSHFAFLTLPQYSMIALSNAVEPLRMANSISGQLAYEWSIASLDGEPVRASNGTVTLADGRAREPGRGSRSCSFAAASMCARA
jgi:transcriptional regulator GlxA family with amidase domain